jgi:hypothetical protein
VTKAAELPDAARQTCAEVFEQLAAQWKEEITYLSALDEICGNINYLKIIGLGPIALPLILAELKSEPYPWFVALEAISRENPVLPEMAGDFEKMAQRWLAWGAERNLV